MEQSTSLTRRLNGLLELERRTISAYQTAVEQVAELPARAELRRIRDDHRLRARELGARAAPPPSRPRAALHVLRRAIDRHRLREGTKAGDGSLYQAVAKLESALGRSYARALGRADVDDRLRAVLAAAAADVEHHTSWLTERLSP